jgi:hypothetical protein
MSEPFSGLGVNLSNLYRLSSARTRSISPENFTGEKGRGGMATEGTGASCARGPGQGWKVSPSIRIEPGEVRTLAEIEGPGAIQQVWITTGNLRWRDLILRVYWDGQDHPSVECPLGDFFCSGWNQFAQVTSLAVCVNPGRAFNCYWEMPFRQSARITLENRDPDDHGIVYYQVNYALAEVPEDAAYFHAQFRRTNPLPFKEDYTILDGVQGRGHYVGTYMAWGVNNAGWWGEGEIKFFMDGDREFPTICGTGTEDYFCGAYNFDGGVVDDTMESRYREFTTPYAGLHHPRHLRGRRGVAQGLRPPDRHLGLQQPGALRGRRAQRPHRHPARLAVRRSADRGGGHRHPEGVGGGHAVHRDVRHLQVRAGQRNPLDQLPVGRELLRRPLVVVQLQVHRGPDRA